MKKPLNKENRENLEIPIVFAKKRRRMVYIAGSILGVVSGVLLGVFYNDTTYFWQFPIIIILSTIALNEFSFDDKKDNKIYKKELQDNIKYCKIKEVLAIDKDEERGILVFSLGDNLVLEQDFLEIEEIDCSSIKKGQKLKVEYAPVSKMIFSCKLVK